MKNATKSKTAGNNNSAQVVDGKLILSFPDALTPVLWQMDLTQAKASSLEVQDGKKKGTFTLRLSTLRGEAVDVASFNTKDEAVAGLMEAARALENAQGQIRPAPEGSAAAQMTRAAAEYPRKAAEEQANDSKVGKVVGGGLVVLLIIVLIGIWGALLPSPPRSLDSSGSYATSTGAPGDTGVPISADDFLNAQ